MRVPLVRGRVIYRVQGVTRVAAEVPVHTGRHWLRCVQERSGKVRERGVEIVRVNVCPRTQRLVELEEGGRGVEAGEPGRQLEGERRSRGRQVGRPGIEQLDDLLVNLRLPYHRR